MNSQENKQLVMQGYQRFQAKDIRGLLENFSDDIEWVGVESEYIPFSGTYHGKQQVAEYFTMMEQAQEALSFEPKEWIAEDDKVVVCGDSRWMVNGTGLSYQNPWVHVFTIRDGKVTRFQQYNDTAAAEKAFRGAQHLSSGIATGSEIRH